MLKGLAWVGKLIAAGLILSFLSIWTTGYVVTSYLDAILRQYQIPIEAPPMSMSGVWGKLWGADPLLVADQSQIGDGPSVPVFEGDIDSLEAIGGIDGQPPVKAGDFVGSEAGSGENGSVGTGGDRQSDSSGSGSDGSGANGGASNGANGDGASNGGLEGDELSGTDNNGGLDGTGTALAPDESPGSNGGISEADRTELLQMLMVKLPQEALQQLSNYMDEGLNEAELLDIQQIMAQHLDKEEYEQMMEILKKY